MRFSLFCILILALIVPCAFAGNGKPWPAAKPIPGEFIIVLADQSGSDIDGVVASLTARHHGQVLAVLKNGVKAFGVKMSDKEAAALALNPLVDHVEQNGEGDLADTPRTISLRVDTRPADRPRHPLIPGTLSNHCPTQSTYFLCEYGTDAGFWHLDRLDNRGPLYGYRAYAFTSTGAGVRVYVMDTGVLASHEQFEGQVEAGVTYGDGWPANNPCGGLADFYGPGHGTSVASVIAGTTNGVAKNVTIVPVKVWNCDWNSFNHFTNPATSTLWWCWGLDWILADARAHPMNRAVVNISGVIFLPNNEMCNGAPCVPAFENNVNQLVQNNVVVVTSANNQSNANCAGSPARMGYGGTRLQHPIPYDHGRRFGRDRSPLDPHGRGDDPGVQPAELRGYRFEHRSLRRYLRAGSQFPASRTPGVQQLLSH